MVAPGRIPSTSKVSSFWLVLKASQPDFHGTETVGADLTKKRIAQQDYVKPSSPVENLPTEILTLILALACPEYGLDVIKRAGGFSCPSTVPTLAISHVCSLWRNVVLSLPSLWAGIRLDLALLTGPVDYHFREIMRLYIDRSRRVGLDLYLEASGLQKLSRSQQQIAFAQHDSIIRLFLDERPRWRRVSFDVSHDISIFGYMQELMGTFEHLEEVRFVRAVLYNYQPYDAALSDDEPYCDAPNLRTLELSSTNVFDIEVMGTIDFKHVTSVILNNCYAHAWQHIGEVFRLFPHLQQLSIHVDSYPESFDNIPHRSSQTLQSLTMIVESFGAAAEVNAALTLPSLTHLNLSFHSSCKSDSSKAAWMDSFQAMLRRSSCQLQSLNFVCGDLFTTDEVTKLSSWLPTLTTLSLDADCQTLSTRFFENLTLHSSLAVPSGSEGVSDAKLVPVFPRLTSLDIKLSGLHIQHTQPSTSLPIPESIVSMIQSRQAVITITGTDATLSHFGLCALAREGVESEREWAKRLRSMMTVRLREYRDASTGHRRLTHSLELGEM
ncbi:hypothetical protein D9758_012062 [Tetrapyrgos nigripes]|uniref:F-box domain-containing protein n=1 Tax=Tetrapyrgos nigripes TaxID=182062 RepID=A0A8H5CBT2_9AGAR|nr:hypothetical protein D9758_012062 [Tetrapyrgos nigripes]